LGRTRTKRTHGLTFSIRPPDDDGGDDDDAQHPPPPPPCPWDAHRFPRERPFASLGLALSSLSLPAAARTRTPHTLSPHAPAAASHDALDSACELARTRGYDQHAPRAHNPALTLFYLRAKETFLVPNGPYDLELDSDVIGGFFVDGGFGRERDPDAHEEEICEERRDRDPYARLRNLEGSTGRWERWKGERAGEKKWAERKLPPPPDPAVFAEAREIVEGRLRESLARYVTYFDVMSAGVCRGERADVGDTGWSSQHTTTLGCRARTVEMQAESSSGLSRGVHWLSLVCRRVC
jgi:hypothetical protein